MSRPDFSTRGRIRETRTGELAFLGVSALAFCLAVASAAGAWRGLRRMEADLERTRGETESLSLQARAREARKGPDAVLSARALLTAESPPPRVLADLEALLPPDVRLIVLSLDYGERLALRLQVAARRAASYDLFLQRLQESPLFTDVRPGEEVRDGGVRAQVEAAYRSRPR
jgi:hypothetical protein